MRKREQAQAAEEAREAMQAEIERDAVANGGVVLPARRITRAAGAIGSVATSAGGAIGKVLRRPPRPAASGTDATSTPQLAEQEEPGLASGTDYGTDPAGRPASGNRDRDLQA